MFFILCFSFRQASGQFSCGWKDCSFSDSNCAVLKKHIASHCCSDDLDCLWSDCRFHLVCDAVDNEDRFRRHLLGHCHLLELWSLGDRYRTAHSLSPCRLELSVTQEILADFFQEKRRCEWRRCGLEFDDLRAFWDHARDHLRRTSVERGMAWVCVWHGCPDFAKEFKNQGNLRVHLRKHTNEKSMACSVCRRQFATCENFRDHLLKQNEDAMQALQVRRTFQCLAFNFVLSILPYSILHNCEKN